MKKQSGFGLIGVLLIIGALIITAGGVMVWQKKVKPNPTPTPTPTTITPQPTLLPTLLPPDVQSKPRIAAVYLAGWWGPCGQAEITYNKVGNQYKIKSKRICPPELSSLAVGTENEISKEEFERSIYVQSYLAKPLEGRDFARIDKSTLSPGFKLHPNSVNCWRSTDKVDLVCANKQGIIVDHYLDNTAIGVFDMNSRYVLETISLE